MAARWMLYSYDALGLGHVRRMLSIARAGLARRGDLNALLATCSPQIDALPVPAGLDYVKLPSARKIENDRYLPRTLDLEAAHLRAMRSGMLLNVARWFRPDFLLVDKTPAGLMGELGPSLALLRRAGRDSCIGLGWRDILDEPGRVHDEWRKHDTLATIARFYDEIWVYGDPTIFDVREAYQLPDPIADRVRYLGYLAPRVDQERREQARAALGIDGSPLALVTAGGGEDGERLLACYLEAAHRRLLPEPLASMLVTGPFLPADAVQRLAGSTPQGVTVTRFVSGLDGVIAAADVVVSLAGYNTVCEVLGSGTPAVLVPRVGLREEQRMRAARLAERGLVEQVPPDSMTPASIAEGVRRAMARGRRAVQGLRLDGLDGVFHALSRILPGSATPPVAVDEPAAVLPAVAREAAS
jgi:predicted glycosyltransferase